MARADRSGTAGSGCGSSRVRGERSARQARRAVVRVVCGIRAWALGRLRDPHDSGRLAFRGSGVGRLVEDRGRVHRGAFGSESLGGFPPPCPSCPRPGSHDEDRFPSVALYRARSGLVPSGGASPRRRARSSPGARGRTHTGYGACGPVQAPAPGLARSRPHGSLPRDRAPLLERGAVTAHLRQVSGTRVGGPARAARSGARSPSCPANGEG